MQPLNQLVVAFLAEIESAGGRGVLVANAVKSAAVAIDALRVAVGVLVAVITVVPVEDLQAAIGADLLGDRHEPGVVGGKKVRLAVGDVS